MAMGFSAAVGLANLYLRDLDNLALSGFSHKPILFFRFIDDIFFLWRFSRELLLEFELYLNTLIPGITLTFEYSQESISFLDTCIFKDTDTEGTTTLKSRVYFKPTHTHQLLDTTSFHPKHTTKGILKSQLVRFKRLSATWEDYVLTSRILFQHLAHRGYTWSLMWDSMKTVWFSPVRPTTGPTDNRQLLPIISPFNHISVQLNKNYKNICHSLPYLNNTRIITAFKATNNLKKILCRTKL